MRATVEVSIPDALDMSLFSYSQLREIENMLYRQERMIEERINARLVRGLPANPLLEPMVDEYMQARAGIVEHIANRKRK